MPSSPIRKLAPLAEDAKRRGIHVYHLNIGQPDLPTPQIALDAMKNIDRKILEYSPSQGYRSYREKLVGYYDKFNIKLTADDIIITSGGSEAVLFLCGKNILYSVASPPPVPASSKQALYKDMLGAFTEPSLSFPSQVSALSARI